MGNEYYISITALIFSLVSFVVTMIFNYKSRRLQFMMASIQGYATLEIAIKDNPKLLHVFGINSEDLDEIGISVEEFAFLLSNLTVGGIYYRNVGKKDLAKSFKNDGYYHNIFTISKNKRAWPLLKKCMGDSKYRRYIEYELNNL